jgi:hypothetical protein
MRITAQDAIELGIAPCRVYVDGKEVPDVCAFDREKGTVEHYMRDEKGRLLMTQTRTPGKKQVAIGLVRGKVDIRPFDRE